MTNKELIEKLRADKKKALDYIRYHNLGDYEYQNDLFNILNEEN